MFGVLLGRITTQDIQMTCPHCHKDGTTQLTIFARYLHTLGIPFYPKDKAGLTTCKACGKKYSIEDPALPPQAYKQFVDKTVVLRMPWWTYIGFTLTMSFVAFLTFSILYIEFFKDNRPKPELSQKPIKYVEHNLSTRIFKSDDKLIEIPICRLLVPANMQKSLGNNFRTHSGDLAIKVYRDSKGMADLGLTLPAYVKQYRRGMSYTVDLSEIYETGVFKLDGLDAQTTRFNIKKKNVTYSVTVIESENTRYMITCRMPISYWDAYKEIVSKVVSSFKLPS